MNQDPSRPDDTQPQWEPAPQDMPQFAAGPPARKRRGRVVAGVAVALVAMAGLAFAGVRLFGALTGTQDVLAEKVPAQSLAYVTAYLDPGAGQKVNLKSLASKFPALEGRDLGQTIQQGLDLLAAQAGLSFSGDIKPWLGSQIALAFEPPTGPAPGFALLVDSKDDAQARAGMAKVEGTQFGAGLTWSSDPYQGVDVRVGQSAPGVTDRAYAVTDNTVVVSNEVDVVHQVIDTIGGRASSLAGEATYKETLDGLPKSVLGLAYVNFPEAMSLALQGAAAGGSSAIYASPSPTAFAASASNQVANPFDQLKAFKGLGITLSAQKAGLALDVALDVDRSRLSPQQQAAFSSEPRPAEVLRSVPGSAYGVLAISGFKQFVQSFLAQAQQNPAFGAILGRLDLGSVVNELSGQAALEVGSGPTRAPAGAVLIGTNDTAGMQGFLDNVAKQIVSSSAPGGPTGFRTQVYKGIAIHSANVASLQGSGLAPSYAVANGFGILGTSAAEIKAVIDAPSGASMSEAPTFRDAESQVPQGNSIAYLDVQGLLHALGPSLADMFGSQFSLVEPNLEPLKAFIATGETAGNVVKSHVFLLIR